MKSSAELKVGDWYMLANKMYPENRSMDRKVVITALNPKMVYFDQKADRRMPAIARGIMLKALFCKYARAIKEESV
ncbi:hypothetical protein [Acidithiobacillus thiooxidans]|uniref:Uncharacterized protein n=1 Tax=Acidithiobacillus thiooxidans TaxID=930 RepID=A0A1C2I1R1_ACITH|nr:hypothetical protein [Acidithiobacillus thiooxidans]OCX69890.1 hypothetical protein A6M23_14715 [Acidithiobacillus thiooxidans]OCX77916.1 hypothetical protein A6P08_20560 [Acidithiobacillus thiooxidans]